MIDKLVVDVVSVVCVEGESGNCDGELGNSLGFLLCGLMPAGILSIMENSWGNVLQSGCVGVESEESI